MQKDYTLMHEHMSIGLTPGDLGTDSFEPLCAELHDLYRLGVRRIVDLTNGTMGRDLAYIRRLSEESGIQILSSVGYYLEPTIPQSVSVCSVQELAEAAIRELRSGAACVIGEIAWSTEPGPKERKTWEAMSIAAVRTGALVSTHPSIGPQQLLQAEYLISRGVKPSRIIIGHVEFFPTEMELRRLLETGVNVGVDMIGKNSQERDEYRAWLIKTIIDWGYLDRVTISLDLCRKQDLKAFGGYGYDYLFREFLPLLLRTGVTKAQFEHILSANPSRLLSK